MRSWEPLADDDPLRGDPVGIAQLVSSLRDDALALADTNVQLHAIDAGTISTGDAATAFRERQKSLQPDLELVGERIYETIQALDHFARAMEAAQSQGFRALAAARDAEERIERARLQLEQSAHQEITPGWPVMSGPLARPDPGPVLGPDWQGQIDEAEAQMAAARRLFDDACEIYRTAEHDCDSVLRKAIDDKLADPKPHNPSTPSGRHSATSPTTSRAWISSQNSWAPPPPSAA